MKKYKLMLTTLASIIPIATVVSCRPDKEVFDKDFYLSKDDFFGGPTSNAVITNFRKDISKNIKDEILIENYIVEPFEFFWNTNHSNITVGQEVTLHINNYDFDFVLPNLDNDSGVEEFVKFFKDNELTKIIENWVRENYNLVFFENVNDLGLPSDKRAIFESEKNKMISGDSIIESDANTYLTNTLSIIDSEDDGTIIIETLSSDIYEYLKTFINEKISLTQYDLTWVDTLDLSFYQWNYDYEDDNFAHQFAFIEEDNYFNIFKADQILLEGIIQSTQDLDGGLILNETELKTHIDTIFSEILKNEDQINFLISTLENM